MSHANRNSPIHFVEQIHCPECQCKLGADQYGREYHDDKRLHTQRMTLTTHCENCGPFKAEFILNGGVWQLVGNVEQVTRGMNRRTPPRAA